MLRAPSAQKAGQVEAEVLLARLEARDAAPRRRDAARHAQRDIAPSRPAHRDVLDHRVLVTRSARIQVGIGAAKSSLAQLVLESLELVLCDWRHRFVYLATG